MAACAKRRKSVTAPLLIEPLRAGHEIPNHGDHPDAVRVGQEILRAENSACMPTPETETPSDEKVREHITFRLARVLRVPFA